MSENKKGLRLSMPDIVNKEDEKLGQRLQFYREQAGITQKEIADASGLSKNYISAIERGVHKCNAKTFIIYGKKCNLSLDLLANLDSGSVILIELKNKISGMSIEQQQKLLDWLKSIEK